MAATAVAAGLDALEGREGAGSAGRTADAPTGSPAPSGTPSQAGGVETRWLSAPEAGALTAENDRRWPGGGEAVG